MSSMDLSEMRKIAATANRFVIGQSRAGEMFDEFCESGLVDETRIVQSGVRQASIFEFDWGFLAETFRKGEGWRWSFYVQHVWRTGTEEWWEAFAQSHKRVVQSSMAGMERKPACRAAALAFERGDRCFSAMTLRSGCDSSECARAWIGWTLLPRLWPQVLRQTLDPVFESSAFSRLP